MMSIILDESGTKTYRDYLEQVLFNGIIQAMPEELFLSPSDKPADYTLLKNTRSVPFPSFKGLFAARRTARWLKDQEASFFISFSRILTTTHPVKQILIIDNESLPQTMRPAKAAAIGFTTAFLREKFLSRYPAATAKTFIAAPLVNASPGSVTPGFEEAIKEELTDGKEFFISADFNLDKERLVMLLKSFSVFKKMQQSSWKLMIVLRSGESVLPEEAHHLLATYKYRADVVITTEDRLYSKIGAAYALISLDSREIFPVPVIEAIKTNIPVIALATQTVKKLCGDAVIYPSDAQEQAVGDMLMLMYKAETYRNNLVKKTEQLASSFNIANAIEPLKALLQQH